MKKFLLLSALLCCAVGSFADDPPPSPWKGRYKLWIAGDASWHNCAVDIDNLGPEEAEGQLEIDLGLGPDAREPKPDETLHKVRFKAKKAGPEQPYTAEVLVGTVQPKLYHFDFFPFEEGKSLAGPLTMGNKRGAFLVRRD